MKCSPRLLLHIVKIHYMVPRCSSRLCRGESRGRMNTGGRNAALQPHNQLIEAPPFHLFTTLLQLHAIFTLWRQFEEVLTLYSFEFYLHLQYNNHIVFSLYRSRLSIHPWELVPLFSFRDSSRASGLSICMCLLSR